jgi:hypothetical protein
VRAKPRKEKQLASHCGVTWKMQSLAQFKYEPFLIEFIVNRSKCLVNAPHEPQIDLSPGTGLNRFTHYNAVAVAASCTLIGKHVFVCDDQGRLSQAEGEPLELADSVCEWACVCRSAMQSINLLSCKLLRIA